MLACLWLLLGWLSLPAPAAQPAQPLTTLCIGLPECQPGGVPAGPAAPDPLAPAREAAQREDFALARRLLEPLAAGGSAEARYRLGDLHYKAQGGPEDFAAARRLYEQVAEQLESEWAPEAQVNLGIIFALGKGVAQDYGQALTWYEIAAACGSDLAPQSLPDLAARLSPAAAAKAREAARAWLAAHGR